MKVSKSFIVKLASLTLIFLGFAIFAVLLVKFNVSEFSREGVETKDGVQLITLKAGLGYSPNRILASASIPTKLEISTNNTYDCTAFLNIPKLNIKKFLPPTGITEIALDQFKPGEEIEGFCGSDTYKFIIRFS
jgi:plastocyanin domain-containing protein